MKLSITTLSENTAGLGNVLAEWGLSILAETDTVNILLDTGASISAAYNAGIYGRGDRSPHVHRDRIPYRIRSLLKECAVEQFQRSPGCARSTIRYSRDPGFPQDAYARQHPSPQTPPRAPAAPIQSDPAGRDCNNSMLQSPPTAAVVPHPKLTLHSLPELLVSVYILCIDPIMFCA